MNLLKRLLGQGGIHGGHQRAGHGGGHHGNRYNQHGEPGPQCPECQAVNKSAPLLSPLRSAVCRAKRHLRPVRRAVAAGQPLLSAVRRRCAVNRGGWTLALLLGAMALWTLLAWGVAGVLAWLPAWRRQPGMHRCR